MKFLWLKGYAPEIEVAPFAGAWIEISTHTGRMTKDMAVAPFAGAWIEMMALGYALGQDSVAPFAGAWIEICR